MTQNALCCSSVLIQSLLSLGLNLVLSPFPPTNGKVGLDACWPSWVRLSDWVYCSMAAWKVAIVFEPQWATTVHLLDGYIREHEKKEREGRKGGKEEEGSVEGKQREGKKSAGEDVEKCELWAMLSECNGATTVKTVAVPQKTQNRITKWSSSSISRYILKRTESRGSNRYLGDPVFLALFPIARKWTNTYAYQQKSR